MDNNTSSYRDAHAAGRYLASEEAYSEEEEDLLLEPQEIARAAGSGGVGTLLRRIGSDALWIGGMTSLSAVSAVGGTTVYTIVTDKTSESRVYLLTRGSLSHAAEEASAHAVYLASGDKIVQELGRVKDGWAGEGTIAPSSKVLADVENVTRVLPSGARSPSIEIEEDDGTVALRWVDQNAARSFSLVFRGNGKVVAIYATLDPPRSLPWSLPVSDEIEIESKFDEAAVRQLITG